MLRIRARYGFRLRSGSDAQLGARPGAQLLAEVTEVIFHSSGDTSRAGMADQRTSCHSTGPLTPGLMAKGCCRGGRAAYCAYPVTVGLVVTGSAGAAVMAGTGVDGVAVSRGGWVGVAVGASCGAGGKVVATVAVVGEVAPTGIVALNDAAVPLALVLPRFRFRRGW